MAPARKVALDGILFAVVTFSTWGMVGIWVRLLPLPAMAIVGLRMLIAFAGLSVLVLLSAQRRRNLPRTFRMPRTWLLVVALTFYYVLAVAAFQLGTVAEVGLFVGTSPAFILIARLVRRQPISRREVVGAAIAGAGVLIVLGPKLASQSADHRLRLLGDILALASASMSALYAGTYRAFHERGTEAPDPICVALLTCGTGGAVITAAVWVWNPGFCHSALETRTAAILVVLGLLSTAVPSVSYALASRKLPAILATTSQLMIPVVATIAAAAILREIPPVWVYLGGAMILYGIIHMFRQDSAPYAEGEEPLAD